MNNQAEPTVSGWAIASMILGVATWPAMLVLFVTVNEMVLLLPLGTALCGFIASVGGMVDVAVSKGRKKGIGLCIVGLIPGIVGVAVFIGICIAGLEQGMAW